MNGLEERSPQCASYFHTKPASNHTCKAMLLIANTLPVCGSPKNTELNMELTEFQKTNCHVFCGLVQYLKCKLKTTEINWDIVITDHDCLGFDVSSWYKPIIQTWGCLSDDVNWSSKTDEVYLCEKRLRSRCIAP
jgi:hypothetical protein